MTETPEVPTIIEAGLYFADRGIRVFPVKPGSKIPAIKAWQTNAHADADGLTRDFALQYRGHNIGVVADKLLVLDVDTIKHGKGGKDGPATLAALVEQHSPLPSTFTVKTASGGFHYYFSDPTPDDVTFTKGADKFGPGLDLQTGDAYLVGPGSTVAGEVYRIINSAPIVPAPAWLIDLAKNVPIVRRRDLPSVTRPAVNNRYVSAAVKGELERLDDLQRSGWGGAPWDQTTYEVACNLIEIANSPESDYSPSQAFSDFMAGAPTDEKFGPRQHEAKWTSALRKVGGNARVFPAPKGRPAVESLAHEGLSPATETAGPSGLRGLPAGPVVVSADDLSRLSAGAVEAEKKAGRPKADRGSYFGDGGLLVKKLAHDVKGDFGLGPDLELWLYRDGIFRPDSMELMRRVTRLLDNNYRPGHYNAVHDFVKALPELPELTTDKPDQRYINVKNGVYDWEGRQLLSHSPDFGAITQLPIDYNFLAECPEFDRYLAEVVPADTIALVWEVIGYLLMFGNPLQISVIFQGPGGNGKSTMLRVIQYMLGKHNVSALSLRQMNEDRFAVAGLLGKVANLAGDIDSKYLGDASRFKQVVGGDLIDAERKYGQPFVFEPFVVPVFSANEFWKTGDTSHGYFRRWLPIPFPYPVVGKRKLNEDDLFAEAPGIFNRAMVGLRTLMARGKFDPSPSVLALQEQMEAAADILADWFREDESIMNLQAGTEDKRVRAPRTAVYDAFKRWCAGSGHKGMSSTNFYKRLTQLGFEEAKVQGTRSIVGIEIAAHGQPTLGD